MEAARALHIEGFDRASGEVDSSIEVRGDLVSIEHLAIVDAALAALIERREQEGIDPGETIIKAVEIGARVLDREATRAEVDLVRNQFEQASSKVETAFADRARQVADELQQRLEQFLGTDSGEMAKALDAHSGELNELIAQNFGGDRATAVQHQIREQVTKLMNESRQELLRQFSAEDGHNPLADFKAAIVRQMDGAQRSQRELVEKIVSIEGELRRLHDASEAEAELAAEHQRGTAKGRDFEEAAFSIIERMAAARGDVAHHVGDESSDSGSKKGDIVIELDAASGPAVARIVLELKDQRMTKQKAWELLDACLVDREADFALLVVGSEDKLPAGRDELHEYQGNKMIVVLDRDRPDERGLFLAYCHARLRCLVSSEQELKLDAAGARDAAEQAFSALKAAQGIRNSLTKARKGVEGARDGLDTMVEQVEISIQRVESLITAGDTPAGDD